MLAGNAGSMSGGRLAWRSALVGGAVAGPAGAVAGATKTLPMRAMAGAGAVRGLATGGPAEAIEVDEASFGPKVMQSKLPVVLDCYADWCGPCKSLEPILKKAVGEYKGKLVLAKLDTDKNPQLAQALQIKSLPTVLAVYQGKLVHHFVGSQSEAQVKEFLQNVVKMTGAGQPQPGEGGASAIEAAEGLMDQVDQALEAGNVANDEIVPVLKELADVQPNKDEKDREVKDRFEKVRVRALVGLGQLALKDGNVSDANALVKMLESSYKQHLQEPVVASFVRAVSFAETAGDVSSDELGDLEARRADLSSEERFKFAQSLVSQKRYEEAIDEALTLLKKDRAFQDEAAKKLLLEIFELLGPKDDLVKAARRRMASILLV
ncbi:Thioredoxin [Hondaea fermentalgiana]|uniref:Thioredoxin n=1 Tax=Hondaea fermentalgiana TaxID=2315210 RepID=A0A2R5G2V6_9STRA|nr:Thioredoxin [Hondaea fermentalgiana]|eukprot:GBG25366.1 Thioredoxin [Hondaea fermentalgiana]